MKLLRLALPILWLAPALCQSDKPNIVIVFADDMGYGDPQVYNPESKAPTPHIDALAENGMRFTDAHTASSVCTPSRYGLLTGRYPWRSRLPTGIVNSWGGPVIDRGSADPRQSFTGAGIQDRVHWQVATSAGTGRAARAATFSEELEGVNVGRDYEALRAKGGFLKTKYWKDRSRVASTTTSATTCRTSLRMPSSRTTRVLGEPTDRMPAQKGQRSGPMIPGWDPLGGAADNHGACT